MQRSVRFGSNKASYSLSCTAMAVLGLTLAGCGHDGAVGDNSLGEWEQSSLGTNALGTNALGTNALGTNALGTNALGTNALGTNALGTNGINWLNESSTTKQDRFNLLKYLVKCSLGNTQYIVVKATDAGTSTDQYLYGMYGLASGWLTAAMTEFEQRWVTGCVLAHVNTLQRQQRIALHGWAAGFASTPAERATMYASEGRYWGNIFRTEKWKNVCTSGGRGTGYDSPRNFDIILGRSCADDGCGVMVANGRCPIDPNIPSQFNNWWFWNSQQNLNGYNSYGWVYQPVSAGSVNPNSNGYFPVIEVAGPASQEAEGYSGDINVGMTCRANYAYSDGILTGNFSYLSYGAGTPSIGDCPSNARCSGSDLANHPNGQKLRGLPSGTRVRYAFMTGQPVGAQQFYFRMRYSAAGSNVRARVSVNGSVFTTVTFSPTGVTPSTPSGSWDAYDSYFWHIPFISSPSDLKNIACGNGSNPNNMPYAAYMDIESDPGSTFPDIDLVWVEP